MPLLIRSGFATGKTRCVWANQAYLRAVEAADIEDATARSLEFLDAPDPRRGQPPARAAAPLRGARPGSRRPASAGPRRRRATDRKRQRRHRRRRVGTRGGAHRSAAADGCACAHPRPVADRGRDLRRRRSTSSSTTPPISASGSSTRRSSLRRPTDSEVLDRLRAARKLPEQADFRAWKATSFAAYRAVEPQRDLVASARPAHPARRHQPQPAGRRHLSVRRRERAHAARIAGDMR